MNARVIPTHTGYRIEKDGKSVDLTADEMRGLVLMMFQHLPALAEKTP